MYNSSIDNQKSQLSNRKSPDSSGN